jgi:Golgi phosphoprotein 3 (GPP34)
VSLALADELFMMAHDLQTGKTRVPDPALGIGLASALLAELMFAGALVISSGQLGLGEYGPPRDRLSEALYEQTRNDLYEQQVSVREWLASHRRPVHDLVADRLIRAGEMHRDVGRRFGRTVVRYLPVRPPNALIRTQRLPSYLRHRVEVTEPDVVVALLMRVMAPDRNLLELDGPGTEYLEQLAPALQVPLRELLTITETAVTAALRSPNL